MDDEQKRQRRNAAFLLITFKILFSQSIKAFVINTECLCRRGHIPLGKPKQNLFHNNQPFKLIPYENP